MTAVEVRFRNLPRTVTYPDAESWQIKDGWVFLVKNGSEVVTTLNADEVASVTYASPAEHFCPQGSQASQAAYRAKLRADDAYSAARNAQADVDSGWGERIGLVALIVALVAGVLAVFL